MVRELIQSPTSACLFADDLAIYYNMQEIDHYLQLTINQLSNVRA